mmetsp:Transcript_16064/g.36865  ORF Transcript_16064/g.36865 Transcript_16064/m.36865 type:complete len:166 (-) Transcript_16064:25-522(-)
MSQDMSGGKGLPNIDGLHSLKVDGFFPDTRKDEVWDFFKKCGRIGDVYLPREPGTSKGRGFAFVRFYDKKDAEMAVQDMDGKEFQGSRLRVNFAQVGRNADGPKGKGRGRGSPSRSRSGGRGGGRRARSDSRKRGRRRPREPSSSRGDSRSQSRSPSRGARRRRR